MHSQANTTKDTGMMTGSHQFAPRACKPRRLACKHPAFLAVMLGCSVLNNAQAVDQGTFSWQYAGSLAQPATGGAAQAATGTADTLSPSAQQVAQAEASVAVANAGLRLAFIDSSAASRRWLDKYSDYLVKQRIPVMVLEGTQSDLEQHFRGYAQKGLMVGIGPEPRIFLDGMLQRLGITTIPAVVEGPVVWQVREVVPEAAFSASLPGSGGRAGAATEAPSTTLEQEQGGNQSGALEQDNDAQQRALEQALLQQYQSEEAQRASAEVRATLEQNLQVTPSGSGNATLKGQTESSKR